MKRTKLPRVRGVASAACAIACLASLPVAARPTGPATATELNARLRVFATPGDPALRNSEVTAVVRRRDGWLTELWRSRPFLPSVDALGVDSSVDSLWQFHQVASVGDKDHAFIAKRVRQVGEAIEIDSELHLAGQLILAATRVTLHHALPLVKLSTRFKSADGSAVGAKLGDAVRWGNVQYYVSGLGKPRMSYKGPATWVGRHGAQGDLLLRPTEGTRMSLDYRARIRGFQGTIKAHYLSQLPAGKELSVSRELSFEPLPLKPTAAAPTGTLELSITDESGAPIAAKIRVDRVGSKQPVFDEDGGLEGADRFAWTGNGRLSIPLPVGRYQLLATAGLERDAARLQVDIRAGATARQSASLPRVLSTPGWTSADLHLHQAPSVDADISLPARVISVAAEGVELAVATDHYVVTDLEPVRRELEQSGLLTTKLQTMPGAEVSTLGNRFGHFNVFPLAAGRNVKYRDTTAGGLFADARKQSPTGILQVNHPRWDPLISYFSAFKLDEQSGAPGRAGYDPNFDTIEVYNGDDARDLKRVRKVMLEWLRHLKGGRRYVATGSSDSHKLAILDPGLPRTFIQCRDPRGKGIMADALDVSARPEDCVRALKAGHAIVTSGPFIDATVNGLGPGHTATVTSDQIELVLGVGAAPWISVSQLEVLAGSSGERIHFETLKHTPGATQRYSKRLKLKLPPGADFIIVVAQGSRGLPNASRDYTVPFGFTNPIWIKR